MPCERCWLAWEWLTEEQSSGLLIAWRRARARLYERLPNASATIDQLRIVSFENRVLTLAGWKRTRDWTARRYTEVLPALAGTDKPLVLYGPQPGASIARRIQRERRK